MKKTKKKTKFVFNDFLLYQLSKFKPANNFQNKSANFIFIFFIFPETLASLKSKNFY